MNQIWTWVANQCNLIWTGSDFISMVLNRKKTRKKCAKFNLIFYFLRFLINFILNFLLFYRYLLKPLIAYSYPGTSTYFFMIHMMDPDPGKMIR